ncbi:MAG: THUMP domain-containing protein [Candidatus Lokiarchaeota archaeon]
MEKDLDFFQYALKIVPIQYVCETKPSTIAEMIKNTFKEHLLENETFRIKLNRRSNDLIERKSFIEKCARPIKSPVDLENPDKIIRIEVLGNVTGISYLRKEDVIKIEPKFH